MIYKFGKAVEYTHMAIIEADSLEEALEKLKEDWHVWEEDDGGEGFVTWKRIQIYEDEEKLEDEEPIEEISEDDMSERHICFD